MDELMRWLGEQLDEDERIARRACEYAEATWRLDEEFGETVLWWPPEPRIAEKEREKGLPVVSDQWRGQTIESGGARIAPHIARHDPARVLREIDAKRRRLKRHQPERRRLAILDQKGGTTSLSFYVCTACTPNRTMEHRQEIVLFPCSEVREDAAVYADRPGYREEWRP